MTALLDRLRRMLGLQGEARFPAAPIAVRWQGKTQTPGLQWPDTRPNDAVATPVGAGLDVAVEGPAITGVMMVPDRKRGVKRLAYRPEPGWLRVTAWCEAPLDGEVSLVAIGMDKDGAGLGRLPMPLGTEPRDWLIEAPQGFQRTVLAIRFGGPARLGGVRVELAAAKGAGLPPADAWANRTPDLAAHVRELMARRDYEAVLALQAQPAFQLDFVNRAALVALVELRRFKKAIAHQARFGREGDPGGERRLLEAFGNLGRWRAVEARIARSLQVEPAERRAALLLAGFGFTGVDPALRVQVMDRLAATPEALPNGDAATLDVANKLAFLPTAPARTRLIDRVMADPDLPAAERELLDSQRALARGDTPAQWAAINRALALHLLAPIRPSSDGPLTLGQITTSPLPRTVNQPLVSVIMTAFNSASTIGYAVASLAAQTHGALEIILVDDGSSDDTVEVARAAAGDRPFLSHVQAVNGGTYLCRNQGLAMASGRYVLNQDSDDWAHPQKVERLLAALRAGDIAAFGQALRLSPDRGLVSRGGFIGMDGTSLLFEREPVLAAMQGYEPVRAGADGEFHRRMELIFGADRIGVTPAPLSIIAARAQSLSRSGTFAIDQETGVFSAERNAYRRAYLARHALLRAEVSPDGGSR